MGNGFVVIMGIGTVFVGLICIIVLCKIVGFFCTVGAKNENSAVSSVKPEVSSAKIENRQEIIAAVTACCAEEMGTDISALRVVSFKKL